MPTYRDGRITRRCPQAVPLTEPLDFHGESVGPPYSIFEGRPYEPDELEFLQAIDRFRGRHRRQPEITEALQIARDLGWRPSKEEN